jgi:prolyl-tRNA editing enzyme YbaK/EbsC (Cys-tRNA(Pro) deacylase)
MMGDGVARVRAVLARHGLAEEIWRLSDDISTAEMAAAAVGAPLGSIVKSLLFLVNDKLVLVLVAGDRRADTKLLRRLLGASKRQLRIARPEEVLERTGYVVGGVPPVAHSPPLPTLIDRSLNRFDLLWADAGSPYALFPVDLDALVRITGGRLADLTIEASHQGKEPP